MQVAFRSIFALKAHADFAEMLAIHHVLIRLAQLAKLERLMLSTYLSKTGFRLTLSMTGLTLATSKAETIVLKSSLLHANTPRTLAAEYRMVWARSNLSES